MSNVVLFPRHRLARCDGTACRDRGGGFGCFICNGGLSLCETCGGAEASLPTHCPQERMTQSVQDGVQNGELDFKDGRWVSPRPQQRSAFDG